MKPNFTYQPHFHMRTPRVSESMADYASPITRHRDESGAERAAGVLLAITLGLMFCAALLHWWLS